MFRRGLSALVALAYPFVVLWGLKTCGLTAVIVAVLAVCVFNCLLRPSKVSAVLLICAMALCALSFVYRIPLPLKFYPVVVNALMFGLFLASLFRGQSAIERLARLRQPDLPPEAVRYTRRLTIVWCVFFVFNGLVAFWTAVAQPDEIWALYNGFIAYLLIGSLIVGEMVFRKIRLNR